ncbi:MAG: hypothetical protein ACR2MB_09965 [Acidimicrobiales bacterium]
MSEPKAPDPVGADKPDPGGDPVIASARSKPGGVLSPTEQMALELVAAGHSQIAAGNAIGRSAKTVQRLLRRPEAQAFVAAAQSDRLDQVVGLLGMAAVDAARVVLDELHGEAAATRLRACALALGSFEQLRSAARRDTAIADLNQKLGQLEEELDGEDDDA